MGGSLQAGSSSGRGRSQLAPVAVLLEPPSRLALPPPRPGPGSGSVSSVPGAESEELLGEEAQEQPQEQELQPPEEPGDSEGLPRL